MPQQPPEIGQPFEPSDPLPETVTERSPEPPSGDIAAVKNLTGPYQPTSDGTARLDRTAELSPDLPALAGRYRLEGEIAHGGMGSVLRAYDPDLKRTLAVKLLLGRYACQPDMVARFLEEAQITGQLQHPGIPPVHDLGRL